MRHAANNFGGKDNGLKTERTQKIQMIDDIVGKESYVKTRRKAEDIRQWMWEVSGRLSMTQTCFKVDY